MAWPKQPRKHLWKDMLLDGLTNNDAGNTGIQIRSYLSNGEFPQRYVWLNMFGANRQHQHMHWSSGVPLMFAVFIFFKVHEGKIPSIIIETCCERGIYLQNPIYIYSTNQWEKDIYDLDYPTPLTLHNIWNRSNFLGFLLDSNEELRCIAPEFLGSPILGKKINLWTPLRVFICKLYSTF